MDAHQLKMALRDVDYPAGKEELIRAAEAAGRPAGPGGVSTPRGSTCRRSAWGRPYGAGETLVAHREASARREASDLRVTSAVATERR